MDMMAYFRSLSAEFEGLSDRVRHFIADAHWQTDGEWKEGVLRSALRRSCPSNVGIGRGFLVGQTAVSTQVDVLLWNAESAVYFRDGDLVLAPPQAALALIEVKADVDRTALREALRKLVANRRGLPFTQQDRVLTGLFSHRTQVNNPEVVLEELEAACPDQRTLVNLVCLGPSLFTRQSFEHPVTGQMEACWRTYELERLAYGYFIHNVLEHVAGHGTPGTEQWFPEQSKEFRCTGQRACPA